jgi:acyl-CoA synthetase (AMP-forming)/AMP-acid ligase II
MRERTLLAEFAASLARDGAQPIALAADARSISGADFLARAGAWRGAFEAAQGQRFALHLEDSIAFAAALFGAWHAGKTVFLPADSVPSTLASIAGRIDGFAGAFAGALQPRSNPEEFNWQALDPDATRLVLYTSGSSGDPVAIEKTLGQLDCEVAALEARFGDRLRDGIVLGTVSHQHIYGLLFRVLWPLSSGRRFAGGRLGYPEQIADAIAKEPAILVASPALLKRLPDSLDWSPLHSALRAVFCSGGPLSAEAAADVRRLWKQSAIEVFGSTETGGIASRESSGSPWQVLPNVEVRVSEGLLQVRSPHLASFDWLETQDRAREIAGGFELLGRADRLVKLEERRISLSAIERALQAESCIESSRVLMLSGNRSRIAAVVVLAEQGRQLLQSVGRKGLIEKLRAALSGQVDAIAVPRLWRFVESMPVNSQGKTPESALAELFQSTRPAPQWLQRDAGKARLALVADAELAVLDGHFPHAPIVPGVALVDWAIRWGCDAFAIERKFQRLEAMKFQRVVTPGTELDLNLSWQEESGALSFRFESAQGPHASGRVVFATTDVSP